MQEASFQGFFKTIVYMIGFYYLVKILARIFFPMMMRSMVNKAQENFNKQQSQGNFNQGPFNQGPFTQANNQDFQTPKNENPKPTKQIGDYIDYEEIE